MRENPILTFDWRFGDFGLRASPTSLEQEQKPTIHLLQYYCREGKEYAYSIGYFWYDDHEPCWELKFVGDRFKEIPDDYIVIIFKMLGAAYDALTVWQNALRKYYEE